MKSPRTWRQTGDAGDCAFMLAILHALGGKHIIRMVDRPGIVPTPWTPRVPLVKQLFEAQPYIERVEISEDECDVDLTGFRRWHSSTTTLIAAQLSEYISQSFKMVDVDGSVPWLTVEPDASFKNRIIIARSPRYNNKRFPWERIVRHYGNRLVFVGVSDEHAMFCAEFGNVVHLQTNTLMDVAKAVAGCGLFIGNQSSPHAVALGLGVNMISEVCAEQPDCIYPRKNVQYVCDGEVLLPDIAGSGELFCAKYLDVPPSFNKSLVPPGMWQYDGLPASPHFSLQVTLVCQKDRCDREEAEGRLFMHNVRRIPAFFNQSGSGVDPLDRYHQAMANAGLSLRPKEVSSINTTT